MIKKLNLFLDYDGTTVDSIDTIVNFYIEKYFNHPEFRMPKSENVYKWNFVDELPLMKPSDLDEAFQSQFFFDNVKFFENAKENITKLYENGKFNIYFCSIGSPVNISRKTKFLGIHFQKIEQIMLIKPEHNTMCKKVVNMNFDKDSPSIFVDDCASNLLGSNSKYKICYTQFGDLNREWNKEWNGMSVSDWDTLYDNLMAIWELENE